MKQLKIQEYQELAKRTFTDLGKEDNIVHMEMGMITEIGEIVDIFKKRLAYKKPIDNINLQEEMGDLMWYVANWANILDIQLKYSDESIEWFSQSSLYECLKHAIVNLEDESYDLNDIASIIAAMCKEYHFNFEAVLFMNISKLEGRYPDKFSEDKALQRDLASERINLESNDSRQQKN